MKTRIAPNHFPFSTAWSLTILLVLLLASPCWAGMKALTDNQLSDVYAEGFSSFTITPGAGGTDDVTALFNIYTTSYMTIDSLKMGYYDNGTGPPNPAWDQDWTEVQIGGSSGATNSRTGIVATAAAPGYTGLSDPQYDFQTQGAYIKGNFTNLNDTATRTLNSITLGVTSATGEISANFNSFTGSINGTNFARSTDLGLGAGLVHTITANNSPFSITLSLTNGYQVNFGAGATFN